MKKFASIFLSLIIVLGASISTLAMSNYDIDKVVADTASYIYETVKNPQVGSIGVEQSAVPNL